MNKIKVLLKLVLISFLSFIIYICIDSMTFAATISTNTWITYSAGSNSTGGEWTTTTTTTSYSTEDIAYKFYKEPSSILNLTEDEFTDMLGAKMKLYGFNFLYDGVFSTLGLAYADLYNLSFPSALCYDHWDTAGGTSGSTYRIYQTISLYLETDSSSENYGKFVCRVNYINATTTIHSKTFVGTNNNIYMGQIALANYYSVSQGLTGYGVTNTTGNPYTYTIVYLIHKASETKSNPMPLSYTMSQYSSNSYSSTTSVATYYTPNKDTYEEYGELVQDYECISVTELSGFETTTDGNWTVIRTYESLLGRRRSKQHNC